MTSSCDRYLRASTGKWSRNSKWKLRRGQRGERKPRRFSIMEAYFKSSILDSAIKKSHVYLASCLIGKVEGKLNFGESRR